MKKLLGQIVWKEQVIKSVPESNGSEEQPFGENLLEEACTLGFGGRSVIGHGRDHYDNDRRKWSSGSGLNAEKR